MSAKTTATVNIVNADLFVQACVQAGVEMHMENGHTRMGNVSGPYHNCELKYDAQKSHYVLEGDNEFVAGVIKKSMALYNVLQLQNDLNASGRYQVQEDTITQRQDGSYTFRAIELDRG